MQGHLYFIMGVSGSGKGTLRKNLKAQNHERFSFLKSYVTREMRPGEIQGDQYWFISKEEFEEGIEKNDFLEYEINHIVAYYGTKKIDVELGLNAGKILFKEVDTKGLLQLQKNHPDFRSNYTSIFLDVSDEEMRRRFYDRNPDGKEEDIQNRLDSASFERDQAREVCDYIIDATQDPQVILVEVLKIIKEI